MSQQNRIFNKIRKLLRLSESPVQAEAEEAARKAHALLLKYNLSMEDVAEKSAGIQEQIYKEGYRPKRWRTVLLGAVAESNFCAMLTGKGTGGYYRYILVGREHNVAVARWMADYLTQAVEKISRREISSRAKSKYRETYRLGMATGIAYKLHELKKQDEQQEDSRALVVAEGKLVEQYLDQQNTRRVTQQKSPTGSDAFLKGFVRGSKVPVNMQID